MYLSLTAPSEPTQCQFHYITSRVTADNALQLGKNRLAKWQKKGQIYIFLSHVLLNSKLTLTCEINPTTFND